MARRRHLVTALGCLGVIALVLLDLLSDERVVPPVLFVTMPLVVALAAGPRATALVGALAFAGGLLVTVTADEVVGTHRCVLAMLGLALGSTLAVWLADLRVRAMRQSDRLHELTGALGGLAEAVTIADHNARILYANAAAVELLRVGSARELT